MNQQTIKIENKEELKTIQKLFKLNHVFVADQKHPLNKGHHQYLIQVGDRPNHLVLIQFQKGPRKEEGSESGILDVDLLEIVRHRLQSFQTGPYATRENAIALTHVEEALLWMNKRVDDRADNGKLGTNKV
jgi:hypothetical protein